MKKEYFNLIVLATILEYLNVVVTRLQRKMFNRLDEQKKKNKRCNVGNVIFRKWVCSKINVVSFPGFVCCIEHMSLINVAMTPFVHMRMVVMCFLSIQMIIMSPRHAGCTL